MWRSSPEYSPGLLTSIIEPPACRCFSTSALKAPLRASSPIRSARLRVVRHVEELARVLAGAPDVDHRAACLQVLLDVGLEGPDLRIVARRGRVLRLRYRGDLLGHLAALGLPLDPPAVQHGDVVVAEEAEDPQRVGGPPVVLVPVEDHLRVRAYALLAHEPGEFLGVEVVAHERVVQVLHPVDLYGVPGVAHLVAQHALVGLHDAHVLEIVEVLGHPVGAYQRLRVGVTFLLYLLLAHVSPFSFFDVPREYSIRSPTNFVGFRPGASGGADREYTAPSARDDGGTKLWCTRRWPTRRGTRGSTSWHGRHTPTRSRR